MTERYNYDGQKKGGHKDAITSVAFSPDAKLIASGSDDNSIRIWNCKYRNQIQKLEGHEDYIKSVAFSPDGKYIASGSRDKTIIIWYL